jgi:multidrug efflux pump subunit AcrB
MSFIRLVLAKPYAVASAVILVSLLGVFATLRMQTDIFPQINIPVCSVIWTYSGMSADEIQNRILAIHERQMPASVDDIEHLEANAYNGVGVIKVFLHEGADVSRAVSQLSSTAIYVMKYMPRNVIPPEILKYAATDVPVLQLSVSSSSLADTKAFDASQNIIRPGLAVVKGASVPTPYGGKPRVIMVDLDTAALQASGLSPADVTQALQNQNVIVPSGDAKIGRNDFTVLLNNSSRTIAAINDFPIRRTNGTTTFLRDVAHVHDGFQIQTNAVDVNGRAGSLVVVRKAGGASTLALVDNVKQLLPDLQRLVPPGMHISALFDQSIFVKAALNSVLMGGAIAAGLTGLMILLFLGNWRLTLIILVSIPLSVVAALLGMYCFGQTLNTMTLGGFALATGILVDDATVVIENIERHVAMHKPIDDAIIDGTTEILLPTFLSTLSICIVFTPVFLMQGTAHYLFAPLSLSVVLSLLASLALSRTLVPILFKYLMRGYLQKHLNLEWQRKVKDHTAASVKHSWWVSPFAAIHYGFEKTFNAFRNVYRDTLAWAVAHPIGTGGFFLLLIVASSLLFPQLGMDFFPQVDAGQMRLHVRAPAGTRIEDTQAYFARVEHRIRELVGNNEIDVLLDNIGLPYSGLNLAMSDTATVGPMDGEILLSLKPHHHLTAGYVAMLRKELPRQFPELQFFFQPADIVNQVLNFGQAAPIDIRVTGSNADLNYATAGKILADLKKVEGIVDAHILQVPSAPSLEVNIDRTMASTMGISQRDVADSVLVSLSSSAMVTPNFWLDPKNHVSYPLVVQTPNYTVDSMDSLATLPLSAKTEPGGGANQLLMNVAEIKRSGAPMVLSQLNIRSVFDVHADTQGRDLGSIASAIDKIVAADRPEASTGSKVLVAGQIQTMRESFSGLIGGMGLAVVLVYLLMVVNFQSWLDPVIVLTAVPFALAGVVWMLFGTHTDISVPALMGTLMCIGLTTANSILVVSFANQQVRDGDDPLTAAIAAGYTRLRPVLMTAGAMILGMTPMAFGVGEGGEQNAPLGRAVIGGLIFATFATLIFVPIMYTLMRRRSTGASLEPVAYE